ncbi:hypothetical protein [Streptomyces sp. SGAir0957]
MDELYLFPLTDLRTEGYAKPEPLGLPDGFERVTFDHEGVVTDGIVIARYTANGNDRVTVGVASGAAYALPADAVHPAEAQPEEEAA